MILFFLCQQFSHNYDSLLESSSLHLNALERPIVLEVHVRMRSEQDGRADLALEIDSLPPVTCACVATPTF